MKDAKLTYIKLNSQTACPPRTAVPVNQRCCGRFFHTQAIHVYWDVLIDRVVSEAISRHPFPQNKVTTNSIYAFLQSIQGLPSGTDVAYRVHEEGPAAVEIEFEGAIHHHLESGKENKKLERSFAAELNSFLAIVGMDERELFLDRLKALFPPGSINDPYLLLVDKAEAKSKKHS